MWLILKVVNCSESNGSGADEPVHILAYYGWGPGKSQELEKVLSTIREGRYTRAKEMLSKLRNLGMPLNFEDVSNIAGNGVAPGRVHVARAMVEAGSLSCMFFASFRTRCRVVTMY